MQIGVVFPQTEIGSDPGGIRAYASAVEELGYRHLVAYDHVVGADPVVHRDWSGPYDIDSTFHEPMVLFGFLAGIARLEVVTGILIAPQRQTVLVAKQAAEVDILAEGRLRLGVGLGWNAVEDQALGKDFRTRGERLDEQVDLLRRLWTEDSVTFRGVDEHVLGAGIAPPPVQRPIPLWMGAVAPRALRRVGRLADGWFPMVPPGPRLEQAHEVVREAAVGAGRDPDALGMEGRVEWAPRELDLVARHAERWRGAGATHLSVNTMHADLASVDEHIAALGTVADVLLP